jgi:hypothetical protein
MLDFVHFDIFLRFQISLYLLWVHSRFDKIKDDLSHSQVILIRYSRHRSILVCILDLVHFN